MCLTSSKGSTLPSKLIINEGENTNDKAIADELVRSSNHCNGNIDTLIKRTSCNSSKYQLKWNLHLSSDPRYKQKIEIAETDI